MSGSMSIGMRFKLSAMMFLQFMMLPVWFIPMYAYVKSMPDGGNWAFWCGIIMGLGTFSSPLIGMFADRFLNSERVLSICNFICGALLIWATYIKSPSLLFWVLLGAKIFYMPSWSLTATISMANSTREAFPTIRVFGSLGWVAAAVFSIVGTKYFGIKNFDSTPYIFLCGGGTAIVAGILSLFLPATPPQAKGKPMSAIDALGLRALVLLKDPMFCIFAVLILLVMIPFQWYMVYNGTFLKEQGFQYQTAIMNIGQVFEIIFMLLIPIILKKLGYKWAMVMGFAALIFRYICFYGAVKLGYQWLDFGGILIHGLIFGLLVVGSQMYVDVAAPAELRNQAQGLINLILSGAGAFLSNLVFEKVLNANVVEKAATATTPATTVHNWESPYLLALGMAIVLTIALAVLFNPKKEEQ